MMYRLVSALLLLLAGCAAPPEPSGEETCVVEAKEGAWWVRIAWEEGSPWRHIIYRNALEPGGGEVRHTLKVSDYAFNYTQDVAGGTVTLKGVAQETP